MPVLTMMRAAAVLVVVSSILWAGGVMVAQETSGAVAQITDVEFIFWYDAETLVSTFGPTIQTHTLIPQRDNPSEPVWRMNYPGTIFKADMCDTWLAVSADNEITLFDMAANWQAVRLDGHTGLMKALTFSPDCTRLVSTSTGGQMIVWDVAARAMLVENEDGYANALFTPDGAALVVAASSEPLALWDMADPAQPHEIASVEASGYPSRTRHPLVISPDGQWLARVRDGAVEVLTLPDLESVLSLPVYTGLAGTALAFSPDNRLFVYGDHGTAQVLSSGDWEPVTTLSLSGALDIDTIAFDPSGARLLTRHQDDRAVIWSMTAWLDAGDAD